MQKGVLFHHFFPSLFVNQNLKNSVQSFFAEK